MQRLNIGDIAVDHIEEMCFPEGSPFVSLTDLPSDAVERNIDWLAPNFYEAGEGKIIMSSHSWVIRTGKHVVLVDTCCGNDKTRPAYPFLNNMTFPYLERLAQHGLGPEDVNFVMCTHLHMDHVGWNTRLIDGRWVPTFPNAKYIFSRKEFKYWTEVEKSGKTPDFQLGVLASDVNPVVEAGLMTLVDDGYAIDDMLTVEAAEGHTDGHVILRATSGGGTGLFVGDVVHSPLQIAYPNSNHMHCDFADRARQSRRRILGDCAEHGHLILPAHFPPPNVGRVRANGDGFRFIPGA